jgi:signal transduction histidine kinase
MNLNIAPEHEARLSQMPVEYELCMSLRWLSNLRWIAGVSVIVVSWLARYLLGLGLPLLPLTLTGAAILLYNLLFRVWLARITCNLSGISQESRRLARVQIAADWLATTALIHFSGGIESPAILYFFFHITLAAILLPIKDTTRFTVLATVLVTGTALLEAAGILPHHHVEGFIPVELYRNPHYLFGVLFFFTSALGVSAYLATRTTRRLRNRQNEIISLGRDLQQAYRRLEAIYNGAQTVSSTLELQEVLDRLTRSTTEVLGVGGCTIRLLQETDTELCLASTYGLRDGYLQKGCLRVDQNPLVREVLTGKVVPVPDITQDDRLQYPDAAIAEGIRATMTAPLQGKTGPLGILRVYCDHVNCFSEEDQAYLAAVASHGSIAIENAMAYEAVQNLEEAKRKFILMVTHELRSPVGVVRSLLRTLGGGYAGELTALQTDLVERAGRRAEFLQTLIDDLLDLAAGKTGLRATGETEPVDLQAVLRDVVERYRLVAEENGIDLRVNDDPARPPVVAADADDLDRAVTNLVSNAVKYTPDGGRVTLTLTTDDATARLVVADTGIGIPEDALGHLFEEFYRAPNAKAQIKQGTGLGLVITKEIIARYGGTIRVRSTLGEGSTFTITLPLLDEASGEG